MKKYLFLFIISLLSTFSAFSADYYWVGLGGWRGTWSDLNNWRLANGSIPSVIPSRNDNVFLDEKAGTRVSISVDVAAECNNLTVVGATSPPTIGGNGPLNIYGSSEWQANTYVSSALVYQNTGKPKTINTNGVKIEGNGGVIFNETTSITLLSDFSVKGVVTQNAGTFNSGGFKLNFSSNFVAKGTSVVNIASSEIHIGTGNTAFNTSEAGVTVIATDSHIFFDGTKNGGGLQGNSKQVYNNITFTGATTTGTPISGGITANRVEFAKDGTFRGNNTFNELILAPAATYIFSYGSTQTIKQKLKAGVACAGWTTLISNSKGWVATISMPAGAVVDVAGALIQDMTATGGADFVAAGSMDNGNNKGWTFTPTTGKDLYWVGGSGEWNSPTSWSLTSGGAGGACVPGPTDNVFFDVNSGFTPTSNTVTVGSVSYCRDMTASGMATPFSFKSSGSAIFEIYGSTVWQNGMTLVGTLNYRDTGTPKTITSNGVKTAGDVNFYETTTISLLDDFYCNYELKHYAGTWITNGHRVDIIRFYQSQNLAKGANLGSSKIYIHNNSGYFDAKILGTNLDAGTSEIIFDQPMSASFANSSGIIGFSNQKFYDVTFTHPDAQGGSIGRLTKGMFFNKVEFAGTGGTIGGHTINELILAAGKSYKIDYGVTVTITKRLKAGQACAGWTNITTTSAAAATISMPAGAVVDVEGTILKNIMATGGADFTANASIDEGGNTGWKFVSSAPKNLYWVGGAGDWNDAGHWSLSSGGVGGACVPGLSDDVFFDVNSGFTETSKVVTATETAYCRNITVDGSLVPPEMNAASTVTFNIYGSSIWQKDMTMAINNIYYKNAGTPKTITDNGMIFPTRGSSHVTLEETTSVSFLTNITINGKLTQSLGVVNTNDFVVTVNEFTGTNGTMNMGASEFVVKGNIFDVTSPTWGLNAATSHIRFIGELGSYYGGGIFGHSGLEFNDVSFENMRSPQAMIAYAVSTSSPTTPVTNSMKFRRVEFSARGGIVAGSNEFDELLFLGDRYKFQGGATQTINKNLTMGGTPCLIMFMESLNAKTQTNFKILDGKVNYDYSNVTDFNFSALRPHFGSQSNVSNQNNTNLTFDPYDPTGLVGLGDDWLCHTFVDSNPDSYTLSGSSYNGNEYTKYIWTKVGDPNHKDVIGTNVDLDIRPFGYGTYKLEVVFYNGTIETCRVSDEILVQKTKPVNVNGAREFCIDDTPTIADIKDITGVGLKWYATATSTDVLPSTTVLVAGTYYVTQTIDNCESARTPVVIKLIECAIDAVYVNPHLRFRVQP